MTVLASPAPSSSPRTPNLLNYTPIILTLLCYLTGAIPFGLILGLGIKKIDLRKEGSGNLGATNAIRVLGWPLGILILILDISKSALPLTIIHHQYPDLEAWIPAFGLAAILGHVFPLYLKFKGGKGVATAAGVLLVLHPLSFTVALSLFVLIVATTRYVSLGSLTATASLVLTFTLSEGPDHALQQGLPKTLFFILTSAIVFFRHRGNMSRLVAGTESKLGDAAKNKTTDEESEQRGVAQLG